MKSLKLISAALAVILLGAGCAATSSFVRMAPDYSAVPQESLAAVALEIEEAVWRGDRAPIIQDRPDVIINTPELMQAIKTRALRHEIVEELRQNNFLAENEAGLIVAVRTQENKSATTRRERDRHALIVMSENENRWQLYEGLLKANNWSRKALSAVQATFAQARQQVMMAQ